MSRLSLTQRAGIGMIVVAAVGLAACRSPQNAEVEMEVRSVGFDNASHSPVVVLQDRDRKVALPIWIGAAEAQAIAMQMQGINAPRPMTHDLIKEILEQSGVEFQKAVITDLKDGTYYAHIYLRAGRRDVDVDSRPSDAIALAVRFQRPIFVATALLTADASIDLQHQAATESTAKVAGVTVQNLTDELADYFSLPAGGGVVVTNVASEAPDGLRRGDVVLEVDGAAVSGVGDFERKLHGVPRGGAARLSVQRGTRRIVVAFAADPG